MTTDRASYSIEAEVLSRFNQVVPPGERSQVIQRLMKRAVAELSRPPEDIAEEFENHPDFADARAEISAFDATAADGLTE
jgi:hypothetical protein